MNDRNRNRIALEEPAGFKRFLSAYHRRLCAELNFSPVKIGKALHIAASALGYSSWQALRAALASTERAQEGPAEWRYSLLYYEFPLSSFGIEGDIGQALQGPMRFVSARECMEELLGYVCSRMESGPEPDVDDGMRAFLRERGLDPAAFEGMNTDAWLELVERSDWADRAFLIEHYFSEAYRWGMETQCLIREFAAPKPPVKDRTRAVEARGGRGTPVGLEEMGRRAQEEEESRG